jgi:hypothetical protein
MGLSMLVMAAGLGLKQLAGISSIVAVAGTVAYVISFALGAGPVPGLLVPEITPARLRGAPPMLCSSLSILCCCSGKVGHQSGYMLSLPAHQCCVRGTPALACRWRPASQCCWVCGR